MIRHVLKLVWNRKRSTGLVGLEIFICFLVLAGLCVASVRYFHLWQRPLGFDYENVWVVRIGGFGYGDPEDKMLANRKSMQELLRAAQAMPECEAAGITTNAPYSTSTWTTSSWVGGRRIQLQRTFVSVGEKDVLRLHVRQGRWLEESDVDYAYKPILISRNVAEGLFGAENPIGQDLPRFDEQGNPKSPDDAKDGSDATIYRIVGVTDNYHRYGELGEDVYTMFIPVDFKTSSELPNEMLIRVRPGTGAQFEERLLHTFQSLAPQWTYETQYLPDRRRSKLLLDIAPLLVVAVVGSFLILMVGLGLVGVLWLNVTRRTSELGLRRAVGASAASVQRQVLGELWALTGLAVSAGTLIFLQLPLFGADFGAGWPVFLAGVLLAATIIFGFVTLCGLYPAWLATRVQPAAALQYE